MKYLFSTAIFDKSRYSYEIGVSELALSIPTHSIVASCFDRDQIILNKLVEELRTWKEIEKIETNIIYEVLKSEYHCIQIDHL